MGEPSLSSESGGCGGAATRPLPGIELCSGDTGCRWWHSCHRQTSLLPSQMSKHYKKSVAAPPGHEVRPKFTFTGRGVNRCASRGDADAEERNFSFPANVTAGFFFPFSPPKFCDKLKAQLAPAETFFRFITGLPGSFPPRRCSRHINIKIYTAHTCSLFHSVHDKIFIAGHLSASRSLSAQCKEEKKCMIAQTRAPGFGTEMHFQTFVTTSDLTDPSLSHEAGVLHHQTIGLIIHLLVTTSCCQGHSNYAGPQTVRKCHDFVTKTVMPSQAKDFILYM